MPLLGVDVAIALMALCKLLIKKRSGRSKFMRESGVGHDISQCNISMLNIPAVSDLGPLVRVTG
jgi:hypothetical protein